MKDVNKRLCKLLGITDYDKWVEKPDFFSPPGRIDLLKRMVARNDYYRFLFSLYETSTTAFVTASAVS